MTAPVVALQGITKWFGPVRAVDGIDLAVRDREVVSILGPSGCGKTTTLRLIGGFEQPDSGTLRIDDKDVRGKRPYHRNIGIVFQDYALFPHMTVAENIAFGLRHRGVPRSEIQSRVDRMLSLVKLSGYQSRRPAELSGGQQQRVALARALATEPPLVLLDEPLSALDAKMRAEVKYELKEILSSVGATTIIVTHDQQEAMSFADRVIVMNKGQVEQEGTPIEIYQRPASRFVAEFSGESNWFEGRIHADERGGWLFHDPGEEGPFALALATAPAQLDLPFDLALRPEQLEIGEPAAGPDPMGRNVVHGTVVEVTFLGADIRSAVQLASGRRIVVLGRAAAGKTPIVGERASVRFPPESCIVMPAERQSGA